MLPLIAAAAEGTHDKGEQHGGGAGGIIAARNKGKVGHKSKSNSDAADGSTPAKKGCFGVAECLGDGVSPEVLRRSDGKEDARLLKENMLWDAKFVRVKAFVEEHGNFGVKKSSEAHKDLYWWMKDQRTNFKNRRLVAEREARLRAIGFTFPDTGNAAAAGVGAKLPTQNNGGGGGGGGGGRSGGSSYGGGGISSTRSRSNNHNNPKKHDKDNNYSNHKSHSAMKRKANGGDSERASKRIKADARPAALGRRPMQQAVRVQKRGEAAGAGHHDDGV